MTRSSRLYRTLAAEGSTHVDLLIGVYDALAEELRRAAAAVAGRDIAGRCKASERALLLVGHLESWIEFLQEKSLQETLTQFYAHLRSEILRLQTATSSQPFNDLALQVSETRAAWQKKFAAPPERLAAPPSMAAAEDTRMSWTA
jgi:flagellin-specific chaperone FliS